MFKKILCAFLCICMIFGLTACNKNAEKTVMDCLALVDLADAANKYPDELSGGMKSRVSLARALAFGGDLFLFDEPFAALDEELRRNLSQKIKLHLQKRGREGL